MLWALSIFVIRLNERVEGSTSLISERSLIYKQKTNILPNISQLILYFFFINYHENAQRKLAIMFVTNT